jgi:hypothetical protein
MENLIRNLNSLKECFEKTSPEQILAMPSEELKNHCVKEKTNFVESLNTIDTKTIIRERIQIKKIKDQEKIQKRREFIEAYFK